MDNGKDGHPNCIVINRYVKLVNFYYTSINIFETKRKNKIYLDEQTYLTH